jgi:gliding motility-associated-like protein
MERPLQHPKATLIFAALLLQQSFVLSQSTCPNADFSQGNFSFWQGTTGTYANPNQALGIVPGRHTIMNAPGIDPFTCGGLSVIPPGGTSSARLGNSGTGAQAEELVYNLSVTTQTALFIYKYAVVLENPAGHLPEEQPEFTVRILDAAGNPIGGNCGTYNVYGGQEGQNFQACGGVTWLPWSTVGIDLTAYIGQNVFIEFTTRDCLLTGHFGYAYIAAECGPMAIDLAYCSGDTQVTLTAPLGFQQYEWNPGTLSGQQVTIPTPALGTVYTCTMTSFSNQGNCVVNLPIQIIPTTVTAEFTGLAGCEDIGLVFTDQSVVTSGNVSGWTWNFGDGGSSQLQNPNHTFVDGGSYLIQLVASSTEGCLDTIEHEINVYAAPTVAFTSTGSCASNLTSFTNTSSDVYPLTYDWNLGDGSANQQSTHINYNYSAAAIYNVTLTATNSMGCIASVANPTQIFPLPVVNAGPDVTICPGANVTFSASGATNYSWDNGISNGIAFTPLTPGIYTVIGTDNNGCSNTDNAQVLFYANPIVDAGQNVTLCAGQTTILAASGAVNYQWDNGAVNGAPLTPSLGSTLFTVIGTDVNGCTDSDSMVILVNALPTVAFSSVGSCAFSETDFTNSSTDIFPLTYDWSFGDGTPNSQTTNASHVYAGGATYNVTLTATNSVGCVASITNPTLIYALPIVNAGPDVTICPGTTVTFNGSGAQSYSWNNGISNGIAFSPSIPSLYSVIGTDVNGCSNTDDVEVFFFDDPVVEAGMNVTLCAGESTSLTATGTTNYQWNQGVVNGQMFTPSLGSTVYTVIGTDVNGCFDSDSLVILVNPLPLVSAGSDQIICSESTVTLQGSGALTYLWNNGVTNGVAFQPTANGTYTVTGTDANGCQSSDVVTISIEAPVDVNFTVNTAQGCAPLQVTFTNLSSGGSNCFWEFSDGSTAMGCGSVNHLFENAGCYDVTLTTTTALGCVSDTQLMSVVCVFPNPFASFQASPNVLTQLDPTTTMINNSVGAVSYEWDFDDGNTSTLENPTHEYSDAIANYVIVLTAISEHGCTDTAEAVVIVEEELIYYVPNTFTPDGDGFNEEFKPQFTSGFDRDTYHLYIFDRWGQLVFESKDVDYGWNGSFAGEVAQDGTYTWKIEFKSLDRDEVQLEALTGHVNILK